MPPRRETRANPLQTQLIVSIVTSTIHSVISSTWSKVQSVGRKTVVLDITSTTPRIMQFYAGTLKTISLEETLKRKSSLVSIGHGWKIHYFSVHAVKRPRHREYHKQLSTSSYMDNSLSCLSVKQYQCSSSALLVQEYYNYNYGHEISGCWTRGKLRSRYVRAPSLMKRIAQVIPCGLAAILFIFSAYRSKFLCRMICYRYTKSHHSCVCNTVHLTNYVH